jgi:hypothetical protein
MHDHDNVAMTAAFFGLHLVCNLITIATIYSLVACFLRVRYDLRVNNDVDLATSYGYGEMTSQDYDVTKVDQESKVKLLSAHSSCC